LRWPLVPKHTHNVFFFISIAAALAVIAVLAAQGWRMDLNNRLLLLLHLGPPILTLAFISRLREAGDLSRLVQGRMGPQTAAEEYAPKPLNDDIERIGWDDLVIGSKLKSELQSVIDLLKYPKRAREFGIETPKGILLEGPPGTGKTTLAKVVANTAGVAFFALRMDEVVSKWVGESEKNLSRLFDAAAEHAPAVIFIDEVDSIGKNRSGGSSGFSDNLLNHLLQLTDGVVKTEGLYIIAATNRAELVDEALKRPGRLDKVIQVPLPNTANRRRMFDIHTAKLHLAAEVSLDELAQVTAGASGATIKAICNQAGLNAFQREAHRPDRERSSLTTRADFLDALKDFTAAQPVALRKTA
jgi:SpoVK/Ycf46/Vps4 family AAA+-type ATPase